MEKELAMKWVAALRSGKYRQGKHALKFLNNEYCCLGVLCEVEGLSNFEVKDSINKKKKKIYFSKEGNGESSIYPGKSIRTQNGHYLKGFLTRKGTYFTLIEINDNTDLSFNEIADIIEQYYEEL